MPTVDGRGGRRPRNGVCHGGGGGRRRGAEGAGGGTAGEDFKRGRGEGGVRVAAQAQAPVCGSAGGRADTAAGVAVVFMGTAAAGAAGHAWAAAPSAAAAPPFP